MSAGTFYICPTPLGHLKDITLRTLETLQQVEYILAEDTRRTLKLLNHYEIRKPLKACHAHNEQQWVARVLSDLHAGHSLALVSDAGMPLFSDPGYLLLQAVQAENLPLTILPGPSAVTLALAYSGLAPVPFTFIGFLPRRAQERQRLLREYVVQVATLVCFEAPHRLQQTLADCQHLLEVSRKMAVCRELTKHFEEVIRGTAAELSAHFAAQPPQGEITLVIEGAPPQAEKQMTDTDLADMFEQLCTSGLSASTAIKQLAQQFQIPRNQLYAKFGRKIP